MPPKFNKTPEPPFAKLRNGTSSDTLDRVFNLSLLPLWMFPLFFAYKAIELGRLGLYGRGLPLTSSRQRWKRQGGKVAAALLLVAGVVTYCLFTYWLIVALSVSSEPSSTDRHEPLETNVTYRVYNR
jgi:hypothetical protein